jgi:hypothetical protein
MFLCEEGRKEGGRKEEKRKGGREGGREKEKEERKKEGREGEKREREGDMISTEVSIRKPAYVLEMLCIFIFILKVVTWVCECENSLSCMRKIFLYLV